MIPDRVIEMLSGPSFVQIATRDESLRPAHTYAIGALVHEDRQTVTVLVPTARAARILPHLESNGRVALGIAQASHEAYQLKGTYLATRPTEPDFPRRSPGRSRRGSHTCRVSPSPSGPRRCSSRPPAPVRGLDCRRTATGWPSYPTRSKPRCKG